MDVMGRPSYMHVISENPKNEAKIVKLGIS